MKTLLTFVANKICFIFAISLSSFNFRIFNKFHNFINFFYIQTSCIGSAKYLFFSWKMFKKTTEYFLKFLFLYLKAQSFHLIMENNFIQMAALASHAVAYTIGSIFKHIIDCVQLYFTNGFTDIVF